MRRRRSLSARLIILLLLAQFVAILIGWTGGIALGLYGVDSFETSLDEMSYARMRSMLLNSLVFDGGALARIDPDPRLRAEMKRTPDLVFAVFDYADWRPVAGSSPSLVSALAHLAPLSPTWLSFNLEEKGKRRPSGFLQAVDLPTGRFAIAVNGARFAWFDVALNLWLDLRWMGVFLVPMILTSTSVTWLAVRQGLAPLRILSRDAAKIDFDSLNQRLPASNAPEEVATLVESLNDALARLDAGAARLHRFIANAAHELRTPVAVLTARLDAPKTETFVRDLQRDAHRIKCVVEQLLASAQLVNGKNALLKEIDLVAIAKSVSLDAALVAFENRRSVEYQGPSTPVMVNGHALAINSILSNLVDNALHAEPEGGVVGVKVFPSGEVWVIDHGAGIALNQRENIFEPFWRNHLKRDGAGLGLAIAREAATNLGGRIWVEETPGGGATFKVAFLSRTQ